jgi:hypothetical protein
MMLSLACDQEQLTERLGHFSCKHWNSLSKVLLRCLHKTTIICFILKKSHLKFQNGIFFNVSYNLLFFFPQSTEPYILYLSMYGVSAFPIKLFIRCCFKFTIALAIVFLKSNENNSFENRWLTIATLKFS